MNLSPIAQCLHLCLSVCLLFSHPNASQGQENPDRKREFLEMYARAYYPGRRKTERRRRFGRPLMRNGWATTLQIRRV
jgi:hypothetical protein